MKNALLAGALPWLLGVPGLFAQPAPKKPAASNYPPVSLAGNEWFRDYSPSAQPGAPGSAKRFVNQGGQRVEAKKVA